ncbi:hypothetical protein [Paenibacillus dauci]|uniref:hypothetical protein n=1 Tax=Paenibacillus dauci TaxID=1567106 RepID=UPI0006194E33|nr:hypothetical protein [Paenibacillus dauci]
MNKTPLSSAYWFIAGFVPTIIMLMLLLYFFPMTGLQRIFTIPMTLVANFFIIFFCLGLTRLMPKTPGIILWSLTVIATLILTAWWHPQDIYPSVGQQAWLWLNGQEIKPFYEYE